MGAGILTGALRADHIFPDDDWRSDKLFGGEQKELFRPENLATNVAKTERLRTIAERLGTTTSVLALRWVVEAAPTSVVIAGTRNADHARGNAQAGALSLDADILAEIDATFAQGH